MPFVMLQPTGYDYDSLFTSRHFVHPRGPCHFGRVSSCASPCLTRGATFLAMLAFIVMFPTLLRIAFFVFMVHSAYSLIYFAATSIAVACDTQKMDCFKRPFACPEKMARACRPTDARSSGTVREALAKENTEQETNADDIQKKTAQEKVSRHHDLSSVRAENSDDDAHIRIVVTCPGVRKADLKVDVIDRMMSVTGESVRGKDVYHVSRHIGLPSYANLDEARATHADGELVLVVPRKEGKRIPVEPRRKVVFEQEMVQPPASSKKAEAVSKNCASEDGATRASPLEGAASSEPGAPESDEEESSDEWVPLSKSAEEKQQVA